MAIELQPRNGGYRVVTRQNGAEHVLASIEATHHTSTLMDTPLPAGGFAPGTAVYSDLPRSQCSIRLAQGDISITDLEEILRLLPNQ